MVIPWIARGDAADFFTRFVEYLGWLSLIAGGTRIGFVLFRYLTFHYRANSALY